MQNINFENEALEILVPLILLYDKNLKTLQISKNLFFLNLSNHYNIMTIAK